MRRALSWLVGGAVVAWQAWAAVTWGAEAVQGRVYVATAVVSVVFMALYSRDPWWRTLFGRSLMLLAASVFLVGLSVVLFRFVGDDYPGREVLIIVAADATFVAMLLRTIVLVRAQRADEPTDRRP